MTDFNFFGPKPMKSTHCVAARRRLRLVSLSGVSASTARFHGSLSVLPSASYTREREREREEFLAPEMRPRRRPDLVHLGVLLGFLLLCCRAGASIHEYSNDAFTPRSNSFFFHGGSEGLYASAQVNITAPSSDGDSFIQFESVTFRRTKESASKHGDMQRNTGLVEAIIVEIQDRDKIGGRYLNTNAICCTRELNDQNLCKVGEVIICPTQDNSDWPKRVQTFFHGMVIRGRTVWKNPYGYLPGKMAPLMTFYGFMSLAYLLLGLVWFLQFVRHWRHTLQLHYHITAVIALGMCEMAFWYFEYANFNSTGTRPMGVTIWAVTFTAVKKTVSRLLLLVVSMGFGVVRPTLGGITSKVAVLGVVYFVALVALELVEHLGSINDFAGKARLFLVLPVALLDATFIVWIFSSLSKTLEKLQLRRSIGKLELYRKFTNTLAVSVLLSLLWIGYELYFNASDPLSELWQRAWIVSAFWNVLSYILLGIICILWAPSHNPTGYAYSEDTNDDFDDEGVSLTGSGARGIGDNLSKLERKERKNMDHVFGIGNDVEEDKRE
ncbi:lung seven transmembrane domain containing protein [Musa troglodytarum]|uniref:Lung seven transmembrane domain containing protein n=1 Tax=Musa troglodytarum TaxID=320322 RepID=A0A9E7KMT9_9LILI|nr:lung seven transmembrane domain containing protein [Musa troglodytarum]